MRLVSARGVLYTKPMKSCLLIGLLAATIHGHTLGQQAATGPTLREWSNTEGRKITAEYMGVRTNTVMIRMADGKIVPIPLAKLSEADRTFVRENPLAYRASWKAWPAEVETAAPSLNVTETPAGDGNFIYQTPHFRFTVDGNLGTPLMKDLAYVFELTYDLHSKSPFGILAKPDKDRFEAKLFGKLKTYRDQGGPESTAGVYLPAKKIFLAPLDLMGVRVESSVWRKFPRSRCDTTTIIHELSHMLTHDMLATLPTWVNEGYAEYIANIPIEGNAFRISAKSIREGAVDSFVQDYEKWNSSRGGRIVKLGVADRSKFLKENLPQLPPVSTVLGITDKNWAGTQAGSKNYLPSQKFSYSEKTGLYRTAHLIIYYFLQLDGENGISKLQRYVSMKQQKSTELLAYKAAYDEYERKMETFLKLPGVEVLEDKRIRYPSDLTPPTAPKAPFADADSFAASGMEILFDGESPQALGKKIQDRVSADLGLNLDFSMKINPKP